MRTNLVVADKSRTDKTIVLVVSPSLKTFGIPGRPRLFEVVQKIKEVNSASKRSLRSP
jgi:DNA polymerase V